ncbi:MAG TPA: DUF4337 family protein [Steroidobacteraceae bacterium]|nr:DUF4337 family protein [Steroidobacteraceae bacterium]
MEVEVPHHTADPLSRRVGVLVSIVGIFLSVVTIASHRSHTQAVIERTKVNDDWSFYQAKKIRANIYEMGATLLGELAPDPAHAARITQLTAARDKEMNDGKALQDDAHKQEKRSDLEEERALRYDIGEGLLELGLVLCSLYFLARNTLFPIVGIVASIAGLAMGIAGYLLQ